MANLGSLMKVLKASMRETFHNYRNLTRTCSTTATLWRAASTPERKTNSGFKPGGVSSRAKLRRVIGLFGGRHFNMWEWVIIQRNEAWVLFIYFVIANIYWSSIITQSHFSLLPDKMHSVATTPWTLFFFRHHHTQNTPYLQHNFHTVFKTEFYILK